MSAKNTYDNVTATAQVIVSSVLSNFNDVASSVSENVEEVVSSVSEGIGDAVHNISSGMKRMVTSPPEEEEIQRELRSQISEPILPTPDDSSDFLSSPSSAYIPHICSESSSSESYFMEHGMMGIADHFSQPEIFDLPNNANICDIESAIVRTKDYILNCEEATQKRRIYVQRLIQLRLLLERAKEEEEVLKEGIVVKQGHELTPELSRLKIPVKRFCDRCSRVIWSILHVAYRCSLCEYQCHGKCVKGSHSKCPSQSFSENSSCIVDICPEIGLAAQDYRCSQCKILLTNRTVWNEPRLCDYSGLYYCPTCHWNARTVIPARVIHNWEFEERYVSQQAKHFITFVKNKPLIRLEELNPQLFRFIGELHTVKKFRENLILMKEYLRTCRSAQELRLLRKLDLRQHFVDDSKLFSLQDLIDINEGVLVPFLEDVHREFEAHIRENCEACRGKGFICELCSIKDIIFPFDDHISVCQICHSAFHENCFASVSVCPKCIRQSSRRLRSGDTE